MGEFRSRKVVWYSIIRYLSDIVKGEIVNVGVILNVPETGEIRYRILKPKNSKLKSVWHSKIDEKTYKTGHDILNYVISSIDENELRFGLDASSETFINQVSSQNLPSGFIFSDLRFAKASSIDILYQNLLEEYVGKKFLDEEIGSNSMVVKKKAAKIIDSTPSLSKIIKSNILIKPIKTLNKSYTIDFGYANEEKIELIHSTPEKLKAAYEWLERINFITENYTESNKITLLYKSRSESNKDGSLIQMLDYLKQKDERITSYDIFSELGEIKFTQELQRIGNVAQPIEVLERIIS
ncbi:DUF3037 domain-containing protein [Enterococcus avium]|uniref:DUF3037 domain-containing protein n=1 Tax=Enterococcus avium TaxID=33945 RepID=UPI002046D59E|nr:MAG TPA: Protein of unknown function (DUF3037) [Caudoviricetes sp.]